MYWNCNSMNNLSSYCGLVDGIIRASDKNLPVPRIDCIWLRVIMWNRRWAVGILTEIWLRRFHYFLHKNLEKIKQMIIYNFNFSLNVVTMVLFLDRCVPCVKQNYFDRSKCRYMLQIPPTTYVLVNTKSTNITYILEKYRKLIGTFIFNRVLFCASNTN